MKLIVVVVLVVAQMASFASISKEQLVNLIGRFTYGNAVKECENRGMNLIKILDDKTNTAVFGFANQTNLLAYWIDGTDIGGKNEWKYNDGTPLTYSKYLGGRRIRFKNRDCIVGKLLNTEFWQTFKCDKPVDVICSKNKSAGNV